MNDQYDDRKAVEAEFPKDRWEHIPVKNSDEAGLMIATIAFASQVPIFGEARWFGPRDGVVILEKPAKPLVKELAKALDKKKWWQFWK